MNVVKVADAAGWLRRAQPLLLADEARHNLILGLAGTLRDRPGDYPDQRLWLVEHGGVRAAALQTPPQRLVLARADADAAVALAAAVGAVPGVVGALPEAELFADAWTARTDGRVTHRRGQGIYELERVAPPRPASGAPRRAVDADRPLLREWLHAFAVEALGEDEPRPEELERLLDQRLGGDRWWGFVVWEDGGTPVSMTAFGNPTPNGVRIGPVYTPPGSRGHGYASSLVAHVSQELLDGGRRFCFLYTDLANPTSNRIYVALGYRRVCDSAEIDFLQR